MNPSLTRKLTAFTLPLLLAAANMAQAQWLNTYDYSALDIGSSFPSTQGGVYQALIGNSKNKFSSLALLDEQGVPLWRRKLYTGGIDFLFSHELANGQIFVSGLTQATVDGPQKAVWAKFRVNRSTGRLTPLFRKTFQSDVNGFFAFEEPTSHKFFGLGQIQNNNSSTDMLVSQINPRTGETQWLRRLNNGVQDTVSQILPVPGTNKYILAGATASTADIGTNDQKILIGLLNGTGKPISGSFKTYGASSGLNAGTLLPISGGNYLLIGNTSVISSPFGFPVTTSSAFVIKLKPDLSIAWKKTLTGPDSSSILASSGIENSNGSFIIDAIHTPAFSLSDPFGTFKHHPVTIKLSATGRLVNSKRYEFGDSDTGSFTPSPDGGYLFQGTTSTLTARGVPQNLVSVYGLFDNNLQPVWNKSLALEGTVNGAAITPAPSGFWLTGSTLSTQTAEGDLLLGLLNNNGNIPGCPEIQAISPTIVNAGVSAGNVSWTPKATTVSTKSVASLVVEDLTTLNNRSAPLPIVNTLCN